MAHNVRLRHYPAIGMTEVMVASKSVFGGSEPPEHEKILQRMQHVGGKMENCCKPVQQQQENIDRAARRARAAVRSYGYANADVWTWFVTLTVSPDASIDRYNITDCVRRQGQWLSNQVKRHGLCYVLVPELHKDGAIHWHGFFNDALPMVDSGTMIVPGHSKPIRPRSASDRACGKPVYNCPAWKYGFSTAIRLEGDRRKAISYVCKYIGKRTEDGGCDGKIGGRWYYSGGDLRKPEETYADIAVEDFEKMFAESEYDFEAAGMRFAVSRMYDKLDKGANENDGRKIGDREERH